MNLDVRWGSTPSEGSNSQFGSPPEPSLTARKAGYGHGSGNVSSALAGASAATLPGKKGFWHNRTCSCYHKSQLLRRALCGLPLEMSQKLQLIQNATEHTIVGTSKYDHITPARKELHWLPLMLLWPIQNAGYDL